MDVAEPIQSLIPGVSGRVLAALVEVTMPLSGRALAALAGVSPAQAARHLPRLVELGLVEAQSAPPAVLYSLVEDHVAVGALQALSRPMAIFVERLALAVAELEPSPSCLGAFGSFARGDAVIDSDIDLLVVRPALVDEDGDEWLSVVDAIRDTAGRLSGNRVDILDYGRAEVSKLLRGQRPLWRNIRRDFMLIHGLSIDEL